MQMTQNRGSIKECLKQWFSNVKKKFRALVALFLAVFNLRTWNSQHAKYTKNNLKQSWSCSKGEAAAASANIKGIRWHFRSPMDTASYRFEQISYITCHDVSISKHRAQDPLQELSSETYPFQEVSLQNLSFAGTVLRNHILCRNCLCKPYPLQELSLQTVSFTGTTFTDQILHTQELSIHTSVV